MEAIFFALLAYLGAGIGDLPITLVIRRIGPYSTLLWNLMIGFLLSSLFIPFALPEFKNFTPTLLLLNITLGVMWNFSSIALYQSLKIANASLMITIAAAFPAITVILAALFLNEAPTSNQIGAIAITFVGLFLSTFDIKSVLKERILINKGVALAFIALLANGIYFAFIKIPVQHVGWFWPNFITLATFPAIFLFIKLKNITITHPKSRTLLLLISGVLLFRMAEFSYNVAISRGLTSIVAPIAGASPTLFVVLAFFVLKDPITKQQILGIITTLVGIILLSVFSV